MNLVCNNKVQSTYPPCREAIWWGRSCTQFFGWFSTSEVCLGHCGGLLRQASSCREFRPRGTCAFVPRMKVGLEIGFNCDWFVNAKAKEPMLCGDTFWVSAEVSVAGCLLASSAVPTVTFAGCVGSERWRIIVGSWQAENIRVISLSETKERRRKKDLSCQCWWQLSLNWYWQVVLETL